MKNRSLIRHQVERDLRLVSWVGAAAGSHHLFLTYPTETIERVHNELLRAGAGKVEECILLHPG